MSVYVLASLLLRVVALVWFLAGWRRMRDWRVSLFVLILGLLLVRQVATAFEGPFENALSFALQFDDGASLLISVLLLLGVWTFQRGLGELRATKQELERSEALLKEAIEVSPAGIVIADAPDGRIRIANSAAIEIQGDPRERLTNIGMDLYAERWRPHHPDGRIYRNEDLPLSRALTEGVTLTNTEIVLRRHDGQDRWILVNAAPVRDGKGRIIAGVVVFPDVTEMRRAEHKRAALEERLRHAQKMEALGTLAGGIAHDFNNILTGMIGFTELSIDELPPGSDTRLKMEKIRGAAARAKRLVDQILAFSRDRRPELRTTTLQAVVGDAMELLRAATPSTITMTVSIDRACGPILADAAQIEQVLVNLVSNSVYAMRDCGGKLEVSGAEVDVGAVQASALSVRPGRFVRLSVQDEGLGMDCKTMERIFEPFFTTKQVNEGTGLGLAVVHGIVTNHGGSIHVSSVLGQGSRFDVYVPRAYTYDVVRKPPEAIPVGGNEHILFVDDEPNVAEVARENLVRLGYQVTLAHDGRAALDLFRERPERFDLVISDLTMPLMNGEELAHEIRRVRADIPVLLSTGFNDNEMTSRLRRAGLHHVLRKPYTRAELAAAVRATLELSSFPRR